MMDGDFYKMSLVELFEFFDEDIIYFFCSEYGIDAYIEYCFDSERYNAEIKVYIDFEDVGIEDFEEEFYMWVTSICSNWRKILDYVTKYSFEIWDKQEKTDYKKTDYEYQVRKDGYYEFIHRFGMDFLFN